MKRLLSIAFALAMIGVPVFAFATEAEQPETITTVQLDPDYDPAEEMNLGIFDSLADFTAPEGLEELSAPPTTENASENAETIAATEPMTEEHTFVVFDPSAPIGNGTEQYTVYLQIPTVKLCNAITIKYKGGSQNKEYETELNYSNNYTAQITVEAGEYTIESIKTNTKDVKVQAKQAKFKISPLVNSTTTIEVVESRANFIVRFLRHNWLLFGLLVGCSVAYGLIWYRKNSANK